MKNFKIALIALFAIAISSCSDDDGPGFEFNQENLQGTYEITFLREVDTESVQLTNSTIVETVTINGSVFTDAQITFNNNSYTISGSYVADEVTRVDGSVTNRDEYIVNLDSTVPYTINEDDRSIMSQGETITFTRFTSSSATLIIDEDFGDGDRFESEIRLKRIND